MHARALLKGDFIDPPSPLGAARWHLTSAVRCRGRYRYLCILQMQGGLNNTLALALVRALRRNIVLDGLQRGQDYQWGGLGVIGFRAKSTAALYRLFVVLPD